LRKLPVIPQPVSSNESPPAIKASMRMTISPAIEQTIDARRAARLQRSSRRDVACGILPRS
jgi:hypothetical protein